MWWHASRTDLVEAEHKLHMWGLRWWEDARTTLSPGVGSSSPPLTFEQKDVPIGDGGVHAGSELQMHHVVYGAERSGPALVFVHGFGSGTGIFYAALPLFAERHLGPVYAVDMLGSGLSSRPAWKLGYGDAPLPEVEAFFIDSLERWRRSLALGPILLCGHSVGGYLSVAYALKFPQAVGQLVLISPVGLPEPPEGLRERRRNSPFFWRLLSALWASGWSPMTVAKCGLGHSILSRYVNRRFSDASWTCKPELQQYFYANWTGGANSGGAYAHATLLQPGAWARQPLASRILELSGMRVHGIYGDRDWMDISALLAVRADAGRHHVAARGIEMPSISACHVFDGGHNMMVDNPIGFVDAVLAGLDSAPDGGVGAHGALFGQRAIAMEMAKKERARVRDKL